MNPIWERTLSVTYDREPKSKNHVNLRFLPKSQTFFQVANYFSKFRVATYILVTSKSSCQHDGSISFSFRFQDKH